MWKKLFRIRTGPNMDQQDRAIYLNAALDPGFAITQKKNFSLLHSLFKF
jgi:hypothetical protein